MKSLANIELETPPNFFDESQDEIVVESKNENAAEQEKQKISDATKQIENLPIKKIDKEIKIDPKTARIAFSRANGIIDGTVIGEIAELQETTKDSFFQLYANLAQAVLDSPVAEVPQKEKEIFFKNLKEGFSFLGNEERDKDDDMAKAIGSLAELVKPDIGKSRNPIIENILESAFEKTFPEVISLIEETKKNKSKNLFESPDEEEKSEEEKEEVKSSKEKSEKDKKKSEKDDEKLKDNLIKGGMAATMIALTGLVPPPPFGGALISLGLYFAYKKLLANDKDEDKKLKDGIGEEISPEVEKYAEAWKEFLPKVLTDDKLKNKKTNFEETSEELATETLEETEAVKKSLEEERVKLQDQNKKVHQELLSRDASRKAEEPENEVKKSIKEGNPDFSKVIETLRDLDFEDKKDPLTAEEKPRLWSEKVQKSEESERSQ